MILACVGQFQSLMMRDLQEKINSIRRFVAARAFIALIYFFVSSKELLLYLIPLPGR